MTDGMVLILDIPQKVVCCGDESCFYIHTKRAQNETILIRTAVPILDVIYGEFPFAHVIMAKIS